MNSKYVTLNWKEEKTMCPNHAVTEGPDHETWSTRTTTNGVMSKRNRSRPSKERKEEDPAKLLAPLNEGRLGIKYIRAENTKSTYATFVK